MRRKYIDYSSLKNLDKPKISYNTILNWITDIWWDDKLITSSMVKYSFRNTGISNKFYKSEDSLFQGSKKLREEVVVGKDVGLKNLEVEDDFDD